LICNPRDSNVILVCFMGKLKSYFFRGLAVLLPTMLTIWIIVWGYTFIQNNISVYINRGLVKLVILLQVDMGIGEEALTKILVDGAGSIVGFILALAAVFIVGVILASVVGKTLWRLVERFIMNTPFLRQIYPYIKQITDFLFTKEEKQAMFSRVVAVEYPRKGVWSMGFVTGNGLEKITERAGGQLLSVLIPTSPTPFTGFVIMLPKEQVIDLDMSVEEAIRFAVSGGVISPNSEPKIALASIESDGDNSEGVELT